MRKLAFLLAWIVPAAASAGGLLVGENGAQGMQRGGAFVARADDPTAIAINPAGIVKGKGWQLYLGSNLANLSLKFQRSGSYEAQPDRTPEPAYVGDPYPEVQNEDPPQFLPFLGATYRFEDLPLAVGLGVFGPSAAPGRTFPCTIDENCQVQPNGAPSPVRYDIVNEEAVVVLPSLAVAYRVIPELDIGVRLSWAFGHVKARSFTWGVPNSNEDVTEDGDFKVEVSDSFIPAMGIGVLIRPMDNLEIGASWSSPLVLDGKGHGEARLGDNVSPFGPTMLVPVEDQLAKCEPGGTASALKACVKVKIPMHAQLGARYIFRDGKGAEQADVELDLRWENWSQASDVEVIVDAREETLGLILQPSIIKHGFKDVFSVRLGGSYQIPIGDDRLHLRAGVAFDTAAAPESWTRVDWDGKERFLFALGGGYEISWFRVDLGVGFVVEPERTVAIEGTDRPVAQRNQPDPIQPAFPPENQTWSPFNAGTYASSYFLASLGLTAKF